MRKRVLTAALILAVCLGLAAPAAAAGRDWSIEQVQMGDAGAFVVTSDHSLYTWGEYDDQTWEFQGIKGNLYSSLWPNGTYTHATKVMDDVQAVATAKFASTSTTGNPGITNLMILKTDRTLWIWGENICGQLGQGTRQETIQRSDFTPVKVMDNVKAMDCGGSLCAAITTNGDLYCWGYVLGRIGGESSTQVKYQYIPTPTKMLSNVVSVACGAMHTVALTADGTVYAMGDRTNGIMGDGASQGELAQEMIRVMDGCTDIAAGKNFSLAVKQDGTVYAWGSNLQNQFGRLYSEVPRYTTPTAIMTGVKKVSASDSNAAFIKTDNSLWITGSNRFGIHGQGRVMYNGSDDIYYPYGPVRVDTDVKIAELNLYAMLYVKNNNVMYGTGSSAEGVPHYTYGPSHELYRATKAENDGSAVVAIPTIAGISCTPFYDVAPSAYCYGSVLWARDHDITAGTGGGSFSPNGTCTRGEILTFLWRAAGSPSPQGSGAFSDVSGGDFYASAAQWASEQGLVPSGTFGASAPCTRADVASYLWKLAGSPNAGSAAFSDVPAGADYAQAVAWASSQGITSGATSTTFAPNDTCTRGQIVTFLYRAFAD